MEWGESAFEPVHSEAYVSAVVVMRANAWLVASVVQAAVRQL